MGLGKTGHRIIAQVLCIKGFMKKITPVVKGVI